MSDESERSFLTHWDAAAMEASGAWAERRRLAAAMRAVIDRLVQIDAPEAELRTAADALERYGEQLARHPRPNRYVGWAETANAGDVGAFFDQSPLIGNANPLAPPLRLWIEGGRVHGSVHFGAAYEGPPGCVHGGWVAAAFDETLGYAQSLSGSPGMTGTLTVRYRKPTPLHTDLRFEAWVDSVSGRKVRAAGTLHAGDLLVAEAEAIFISVSPEKFRGLVEARERRVASDPD
jgi:acyl-coenzyme A thioesterase PaaI-like protein